MVRTLAAALALGCALGAVAAVAAPAGAQCVGPRVTVAPSEFARGDRVTISGEYWGDACNDVQIVGESKPVLGKPVQDIQVLVFQGERHIVVARGAADANYAFTVHIRIPRTLQPGPASILANSRRSPALGSSTDRLTITADPPAHVGGKVKVVEFGR